MHNVQAWGVRAADKPLAPVTIQRREPRPNDVVIDIHFCGVCHSDIHQARDEWSGAIFPMVPGHEIVGRVNSQDNRLSVARLYCPQGWIEPAQRPEFLEVTLVLSGRVCVESGVTRYVVQRGQAIVTEPGERVQYSTPDEDADYVAVCLPAFSPQTVHRDA